VKWNKSADTQKVQTFLDAKWKTKSSERTQKMHQALRKPVQRHRWQFVGQPVDFVRIANAIRSTFNPSMSARWLPKYPDF
jgi:hypothetical protein